MIKAEEKGKKIKRLKYRATKIQTDKVAQRTYIELRRYK